MESSNLAPPAWPDYTSAMPDEEIQRHLLALNRERSDSTSQCEQRGLTQEVLAEKAGISKA